MQAKLFKKLGKDNRNKDVRREQQAYLDQYLENQISPTLWCSVNPQYRLDNTMSSTEFRDTYKGIREEPVDKIYFRKADFISKYAEAI